VQGSSLILADRVKIVNQTALVESNSKIFRQKHGTFRYDFRLSR